MSEPSLVLTTRGSDETERLGSVLVRLVRWGTIALRGELASGKTCLVRGMARALSGGASVHSPTFTLVNEYGDDLKLYHMDLYRLSGPGEVADLGYEELFEGAALCVVEWAERAESLLPERRLDIAFEHAGEDLRRLAFTDRGLMPPGWEAELRACLAGRASQA